MTTHVIGRAEFAPDLSPRSGGYVYDSRTGIGEPFGWPHLQPANDNVAPASCPKVVAFTGLAGAGKSTAADILVKRGYGRVKFAGPLKAMMRAIGLTDDHIEGNLKEIPHPWLQGQTPRYAMQTLGTEWGRNIIGEKFWTGLWWNTARDVVDAGGMVVTDDCRFPNELETIRSLGGVVIRIAGRGGISGGHSSEKHELEADAVIQNTGTLLDLEKNVLTALDVVRE